MSKIKALINPVTPFQQNAPIIFGDKLKSVLVDPWRFRGFIGKCFKNDLVPEKIFLTTGI